MTNPQQLKHSDLWTLWNRDSFSPDIFIEWSWLCLVAAALQRRVWYSNDTYPQYANMYTLFVGPPGVGKGLQLDQLCAFLKHHKKRQTMSEMEREVKKAQGMDVDAEEMLFPFAADSTTFESLMQEFVAASDIFKVPGSDKVVAHASLIFALDEFTSIFKKHAEDIVTMMCTAWNCKDITRKTKRNGNNLLRNPCLNMFAGTTPDNLIKLQRTEIVDTGFSARIMIVYAPKSRGRGIKIPAPDESQREAKIKILEWLKVLSNCYGEVNYTPEAEIYLNDWWKDRKRVYVNTSNKLANYYERKLNHVHKVAMAMHFSEPGFNQLIPLDTVKRAIDLLARTEKNMHVALEGGGRNPLGPVTKAVGNYICSNPDVAFSELLVQFCDDASSDELTEVLEVLQAQGVVVCDYVKKTYGPSKGRR